METNPLNNLAHSIPNKDPAIEREHFKANLEDPCAAWENQKPSLGKWKEMENTMMNLSGRHEVEHINAKDKMAQRAAEVFSKRAKELEIHNTKISSKQAKHKKG